MSFHSPLNHAKSLQLEIKHFAVVSTVLVMKHVTKQRCDCAMIILHMLLPLREDLVFDGIVAVFNERYFKPALGINGGSFDRSIRRVTPAICKDCDMGKQ